MGIGTGTLLGGGVLPSLPDSVAVTIIAGLLSLLPVFILLWIYYVRERQPSVAGSSIARFFFLGMLAVGIAIVFERLVYKLWGIFSPETVQFFFAENIHLADVSSVIIAAIVSFFVIALIEEGVRFSLVYFALKRLNGVDQMIDGVQLGIALGLGFAFLENTLYFVQLFQGLEFDILVMVFFLRFLISTVGHMAFGGVMGFFFAMALVYPTERKSLIRRALFFPWLMHGLFDFLLSVQLSFYTVLLLLIPLAVLWSWWHDGRLFELHVLNGRRLKFPLPPYKKELILPRVYTVEILPTMTTCPNCYMPISERDKKCPSCGVRFSRRGIPRRFPFLPFEV